METIDLYVTAHLLGWVGKSLILRNNIVIWMLSFGFEILELSLKHILPNFHECWWDHLILDLFGCNLIGIIIGNYLIDFLNMERFHYFFEPTEESLKLPYYKRFFYSFNKV